MTGDKIIKGEFAGKWEDICKPLDPADDRRGFTVEKVYSWCDLPWWKRWFCKPKMHGDRMVISTYVIRFWEDE